MVPTLVEDSKFFCVLIEVNGCYFNTNGFYINTMIFSNTMTFNPQDGKARVTVVVLCGSV